MKKKGFWGAVLSAAAVILYYGAMLAMFLWVPDTPVWAKILLCLLEYLEGKLRRACRKVEYAFHNFNLQSE